jgi:phosphate/sulfate permease
MEFFLIALVILFALAISDLVVGVANDAVNFLNSAVGSRVAPRHVIMIVASLGMLAGVTFSSGMMEVARSGIFHPQFFTMPELIMLFLAVMFCDILLLDLYNTYGLPTSTTVSIVFELLGAAVAVSVFKLVEAGRGLGEVVSYINTAKALAIISGILISVAVAFVAGAVIQLVSRLLLTFDYERRLRRWGGLWGGLAMAAITYFILVKGAKGASFLAPETVVWINTHTGLLFGGAFAVSAAILQVLLLTTRINILKPIVLIGTFALAMAFAANDLVNFIGVPLAGFSAYAIAQASSDPLSATMEALRGPVRGNTLVLLGAGAVMVATLWLSRKARSVTRTEVRLGRQEEGFERFESNALSRSIVRLVSNILEAAGRVVPGSARRWAARRLDRSTFRPPPARDGKVPSFDLVRAAVNLMVSSALISFATSLKLPLSTTYVTFMVAMGSSLSDQAWGRDSAVYRVSGVLTVIGGWFFTAMMAFTVSFIFAAAIFTAGVPAMLGIIALSAALIYRTHRVHRRREAEEQSAEIFNLRKIKDSKAAAAITLEHAGHFLREAAKVLDNGFAGLFEQNLTRLDSARQGQRNLQHWANIIAANTFKVFRLMQWAEIEVTQLYSTTLSSLQEMSESMRDIVVRAHLHVANHHSGLLPEQIAELDQVRGRVLSILEEAARALRQGDCPNCDEIARANRDFHLLVNQLDQNQIARIQSNRSKTRLSILFYGLMWDSLKIAEHATQLLTVFQEPTLLEALRANGTAAGTPAPAPELAPVPD